MGLLKRSLLPVTRFVALTSTWKLGIRCMHEFKKNLDAFVQEGLLPQARIEPILSRVIACESEADAVSSVAFVTEAVKEDLAVKQELFARLETVA